MKRWLRLGVLAVLVGGLAAGSGCQVNKASGRRQFNLLTMDDDVNLGKQAAPELQKEYGGRLNDRVVQEYVSGVGLRVARRTPNPDLPYTFTVLDSDVVNAFALPGGPVFITRGLLGKMKKEDELAAVLGHEIAHVNLRHGSASISRQLGVQLVLEVAGATVGDTRSGAAAANLAKVVGALVSLQYSRTQESEADRYGLDYMVNAGYEPQGMVRLLEVFVAMEGQGGSGPELLQTHPNPDNRVGDVRDRIRARAYGLRGGRVGEADYQTKVLARLGNR